MNVDEFLRWTEDYAKEGEVASPARTLKLIAIVRKLREQRDEAFAELVNALEGAGPNKSDVDHANAALDEIVRER